MKVLIIPFSRHNKTQKIIILQFLYNFRDFLNFVVIIYEFLIFWTFALEISILIEP